MNMPRSLDVILVVDVESTCWEGSPPPDESSEIIEIGLCTADLKTLSHGIRLSESQTHTPRPRVSRNCCRAVYLLL
jgi:inhibitor of KinA sporulation pathway (predicted exonuclease)